MRNRKKGMPWAHLRGWMLLGACVLAVWGAGCGIKKEHTPGRVIVGVTYYTKSDTFISELNECLKEQLKGYETDTCEIVTTFLDASGSQRTQNDQVEELIDMGCSVLCVNLVDRSDPSDIIDLAKEKDVPIIFYNREPVPEDMQQWDGLYYVGANAKQSGVLEGELAAELILENPQIDRNQDGMIQYTVLEGEPGHQDAIIRTENAVNTLKKNNIALEKLSYQIANWNRAQAQNRMEQLIGQYHNQIELVLANNDDMALGALDAYKKLNYPTSMMPVFFGIDGTDAGLQAVVDGTLSGTVYNDKEGQAKAMAELVAALGTGSGLQDIVFDKDHDIFLPYEKVTADNVRDFVRR